MPKLAVMGPRSRALWVRSVGPSRFFVLMLLPDAFHALTGVEPGEHINRITPASDILGDGWQDLSDSVSPSSTPNSGFWHPADSTPHMNQ